MVQAPTPYYSWQECNARLNARVNAGKGYRTLPAKEAKPGTGKKLDMRNCDLDCLDFDAFQFPGASCVTMVNLEHNSFLGWPEPLLWGMPSLIWFKGKSITN